MADASTGLQHETGNPADGDVRAHARLVDNDASTIEHVEPAPFNEHDRRTVLERDRPRRTEARQDAQGARRISMSPRPNALARPNPTASRARKSIGSTTVRSPAKSV